MYKVIKFFTDLHDNNYPYNAGDTFPRKDVEVSEGRLLELSGSNNKQGQPLIVRVNDADNAEVAPKKPAAKKATATKKTAQK